MSFAQNSPPNVVIILADDMGYGDVAANNPYARTHTPAIDKMVQRGVNFTDAHSAGSLSGPSRYGIVTGRYRFRGPKKNDYWGYLSPDIEPDRTTIGTLMQQAGYTTACIGKWHLGLNWAKKDSAKPMILNPKKFDYTNVDFTKPTTGGPQDVGFDYSYIMPASLDMPPYVFVKNGQVVDSDIILTADAYPHVLENTKNEWDKKYTTADDIYWEHGVWWRNGEMSRSYKVEDCLDIITNEGLSFIDREANKKKPFMLYLPLTGPHTPWMPNAQFKGTTTLGTYGDFVAQIDDIVKRVQQRLIDLGIADNTIVMFASDNGAPCSDEDIQQYAHMSNYGRRGTKGDIWDGGHHIPLCVTWPSVIKKPSQYANTVGLIDILGTLADLTQTTLAADTAEDSFSFLPVLNDGKETPTRSQILYYSGANKLAIKAGDWKYCACLGSAGFSTPLHVDQLENGSEGQLYNVRKDPYERINLYFQYPEKVKELKILLRNARKHGLRH